MGVEGRATVAALGSIPRQIEQVDDVDVGDGVTLRTSEGGWAALSLCDVVIKSPGIPRRREDVLALEHAGVVVTSALALWLADARRDRIIAVTGTKGKSTTATVIAFLLRQLGYTVNATGNLGQPPYEPSLPAAQWTVLEVSSFQATDLHDAPGVIVVTSLGSDHLDWHGTLEQYRTDKLHLTRTSGPHRTIVPDDPVFTLHRHELGGDLLVEAHREGELRTALGLIGDHNAMNVRLALRAVAEATGRDLDEIREVALSHAGSYSPLPGRLTLVRRHLSANGAIDFIDDGLATNPLATMAALDAFTDVPVALIVGGHDRGVDYDVLGRYVSERSQPTYLVTIPEAGVRIADAVTRHDPRSSVTHCDDLHEAVSAAARAVMRGGVVLLSPAAPSFGVYRNWAERSADFTACALALAL